MRILLLNPPSPKPFIREGRCMQTKSSWAALWPPLSLAYCASFLRKAGFEVQLWDGVALKISQPELLKKLKSFKPQLVVVNSGFPTIDNDLSAVNLVKKTCPKTKTALIGMVPTLLEKDVFKLCPKLDFAVVGEPEWTVRDLALAIKNHTGGVRRHSSGVGAELGSTPGVVLRTDFQKNDPNDLPYPARDLLDNSKYILPINGERFTLLSVGRGCPFRCSFCAAPEYYSGLFRKRNPESVVDEIQECIKKYFIRQFLFWGETFTLDRDYALKIADQIIKRKLKINWATTSRADTVDLPMLKILKKAGCDMLSLGIESISNQTLEAVNKKITFKQIKKAVDLIGRSGIRRMGHFIFGLPGQDEKECEKMIDFALKSGLEYAQFYCAVPYPKTPLGDLARKKNWIEKDAKWSDYDLTKSIMSNGILTTKQIQFFRNLAYRKFYFRTKMVKQAAKDVKSPLALIRSMEFFQWMKLR